MALLFFRVMNFAPCACVTPCQRDSVFKKDKHVPRTYPVCGVVGQVSGIAQLSPDGEVLDDRVGAGLALDQHGGRLGVLDRFPESHQLSRETEVALERGPGSDDLRSRPLPEQVPGVEPRPVLDGPVDLVPPDGGGGELEEVGDEG